MEVWKDIKGYEGKYQISSYGQIKSLNYNNTGNEKLLVPILTTGGYLKVVLCKNGKPKPFYIHRLVAINFIPNPDGLPEINHKDEDKVNNNAENLERCTGKYNCNYGTRLERHGKAMCKKIICLTTGEEFNSIKEASNIYNIEKTNISACCRGKVKSAGKHPVTGEKMIWKFKEIIVKVK